MSIIKTEETPMKAIIKWCKEWKTDYSGFQQMETLGYVKVYRLKNKSYKIDILDPSSVVNFLGRVKED